MWQTVTLPHDWAIFNEFDPNALSGGDGGYLDGGVGWYRKTFSVPDNLEGKQIFIGFDGISALAKVWINGHYIAFRPNGYSTFQCDLTPWINYKGENVIAVRAHKDDKAARWYTGAGIYRNVWLTALNPVHIDYCGMYVTTPVITYNTALVKVETTVLNKFSTDKSVSLEVTVLNDGGGVTGKTVSSPARVSASGENVFTNEIMLNNPEKWRTYDPRLYVVRADVIVDGEVVDTYKTTLGIREIKFDSEKGFTLNGESMKFNGVCMHSDLGCLGAAVNYRAIERQLQIMKRMGVNAIRTAHNLVYAALGIIQRKPITEMENVTPAVVIAIRFFYVIHPCFHAFKPGFNNGFVTEENIYIPRNDTRCVTPYRTASFVAKGRDVMRYAAAVDPLLRRHVKEVLAEEGVAVRQEAGRN